MQPIPYEHIGKFNALVAIGSPIIAGTAIYLTHEAFKLKDNLWKLLPKSGLDDKLEQKSK